MAKYLGASIKFLPAQKDSRILHAPVSIYERMVNTANSMEVIFYDTTTRRAWLVGGDDALLYLSRAAISHPEGRTPRRCHDMPLHERFKHADSLGPDSSTSQDVLLDDENRELVIYDDKRDSAKRWRFEDEVGAMFDVLGEMAARRAKSRSCETKQWEVKATGSRQFVGIGCLDLISGQTTLRPRCRDLTNAAAPWLKIADEVDSVNIIGANLDEFIQPATTLHGSTELPTGQDILIAPVRRIDRIARRYGMRHSDCVEIAGGIIWQDPMASFHATPCCCDSGEATGCSETPIVNLRDRRQTFLRGLRNAEMPLDRLLKMHPTSAVAFGSITKTPERRSMLPIRAPSAMRRFFQPATPRNGPMQLFNAPFILPEAPPTPEPSPSIITQQESENDEASQDQFRSTTPTATGNNTSCTSKGRPEQAPTHGDQADRG